MSTVALILTLNRPTLLRKAIESAIKQTSTPTEIIVSDCSDDHRSLENNKRHILELSEVAPCQIRHIIRGRRIALGAHMQLNFDELASQSEFEFVALLDDDDIWLEHHLSRSVSALKSHKEYGLAISNSKRIDSNGEVYGLRYLKRPPSPTEKKAWLNVFFKSMYSSTSGFVIPQKALKEIQLYERPNVDQLIAMHTLLNGKQIIAFHPPSFLYLEHNSYFGKNSHAFRMAHYNRILLILKRPLSVVTQYPIILLLALKSLIYLLTHHGLSIKTWRSWN